MAAEAPKDNCINFVEMKFINNTLYFKAENDENLESDYFSQPECSGVSVIRNLNNQVLFFDSGSQAVFEDMTDYEVEENKDQTTFIMYVYKDSLTRHTATTISVKYKTIFTLSCENKTATFKEMYPPQDIPKEQSDIIFFQRDVPGHHDKVQFESSLYKGYFLACQKENDLFKLILKEGNTCVDKSVMFSVQDKE